MGQLKDKRVTKNTEFIQNQVKKEGEKWTNPPISGQ